MRRFCGYPAVNELRESRELLHFFGTPQKQRAAGRPTAL
jgi:hypothetical protein